MFLCSAFGFRPSSRFTGFRISTFGSRTSIRSCFPFVLFSFMGCLMKSILLTLLASTGLALLTACTATAAPGTGPGFKGPIGLQLYSLRDQIKKDVPGTLDEVKKWGIKYWELAGTYDMPSKQFKAELDKRGLVPISAHFPYEKFRDDI